MKRIILLLAGLCIVMNWGDRVVFAQRGHGGGHGMGGGTSAGMSGNTNSSVHQSQSMGHNQSDMQANMAAGDRLAQMPQLSSKLQPLLPAGTNLKDTANGFKNLGQFVAAVHVAHNLNIPFDQLKMKVTGPAAVSLGKAVQELQPHANAKAEVKKAEKEAAQEIHSANE